MVLMDSSHLFLATCTGETFFVTMVGGTYGAGEPSTSHPLTTPWGMRQEFEGKSMHRMSVQSAGTFVTPYCAALVGQGHIFLGSRVGYETGPACLCVCVRVWGRGSFAFMCVGAEATPHHLLLPPALASRTDDGRNSALLALKRSYEDGDGAPTAKRGAR